MSKHKQNLKRAKEVAAAKRQAAQVEQQRKQREAVRQQQQETAGTLPDSFLLTGNEELIELVIQHGGHRDCDRDVCPLAHKAALMTSEMLKRLERAKEGESNQGLLASWFGNS